MNLIRDCTIKKMKTLKLSKDQFSFLFEQLNMKTKKLNERLKIRN